MNRRAFLSAFSTAAAAIAFDPEKALWTPGKKLISIPISIPTPRTFVVVDRMKFAVGDILTFGGSPLQWIVTKIRPDERTLIEFKIHDPIDRHSWTHRVDAVLTPGSPYHLLSNGAGSGIAFTSPAVIAPSHPAERL